MMPLKKKIRAKNYVYIYNKKKCYGVFGSYGVRGSY